jgi:replication initiation protein RepC
MTLTMLAARDRADAFAGAPRGSAKPLTYLAAFQEAEPYLGLPAHAFKLISWLVKQTMPCDWEEGSRPIAWPSARRQQEFLGLSDHRVKVLNRVLYEAGIFVIRDNEQGKRYGRRGADGRIIEAYGFDLSPLATRHAEFIRIAAEARGERERMKALRKRVTIARRTIRQTGEMLAEGPRSADWPRLEAETADLVAAAREAPRSKELALAVEVLERRQAEAEEWLKEASKRVETTPVGVEMDPHITSTNLPIDPTDTVIAAEGSNRIEAGPSELKLAPLPYASQVVPEKDLRLSAGQLLELAPRLAQYVRPERAAWPEVVDAAGGALRTELGISPSLWREACGVMGREAAALALAIVSTKSERHFTRSAGGYFAGMVRKFEAGELHLDRSLWALREAKWGNADRKRVN